MTTKADYDYYDWLCSQVHIPNGKSYSGLFEVMHNTEFQWTVPNDDNRIQDSLDLRAAFMDGKTGSMDLQGVTLLEILVALSQKVSFIAGGMSPKKWAWKLLKNLRLHTKSDPLTEADLAKINDILDALIWRTYHQDGRGGFFPLKSPEEDQTKVELWYQMNKYVMEMVDL